MQVYEVSSQQKKKTTQTRVLLGVPKNHYLSLPGLVCSKRRIQSSVKHCLKLAHVANRLLMQYFKFCLYNLSHSKHPSNFMNTRTQ